MYESLVELFEDSCTKYKASPLFGSKVGGHWQWISYGEVKRQVDALRTALSLRGVDPGDRVAIIADNCVEWAVAAYAVYGRGACFVPMYVAQPIEEWEFILNDSGAKAVIAANPDVYRRLKGLQERLTSLQHVIGIGLPPSDPDCFGTLLTSPGASVVPAIHPASTDLAGYVYTSGTTGTPKGVKLSHGNICSNVAEFEGLFRVGQARSLAFLPWAHSYGQTSELHFLVGNGGQIAINDTVPNLVSNLSEVKPQLLVAVPRIFNRIYDGVNKQMAAKPAPIRSLFRTGLQLKKRQSMHQRLSLGERITLSLAERLIFSKVRAKFGGQLQKVISGSAALNKDVAEFIDALGIMVYEGYGLTETSPVTATNYPGHRKIGTVGKPIPHVRVELDESKSDEPGEGEIIVYGPNVMQGYHNLPEETAKVMTPDGGFRTGDLGRLDADGYLSITGRIKELYKLENGKYVAPAALEEQIKLSPLIANVMLYGANRPHNVALVVPDEAAVQEWAKQTGVSLRDMATDAAVKRRLLDEIKRHCHFKNYECPREVGIVLEDFTVENGMLTPSLKVKRRTVSAKYESLIESLY